MTERERGRTQQSKTGCQHGSSSETRLDQDACEGDEAEISWQCSSCHCCGWMYCAVRLICWRDVDRNSRWKMCGQRVTDGNRRCLAAAPAREGSRVSEAANGPLVSRHSLSLSVVMCLCGESEGFANSSDSRRHNSRLQSAQLMRAQEETERRRSSCRFSSEHRDEPRSHAPTGTGDGSEAAEARSLSHPRLITATSHLI